MPRYCTPIYSLSHQSVPISVDHHEVLLYIHTPLRNYNEVSSDRVHMMALTSLLDWFYYKPV